MSNDAINWARHQKIGATVTKYILVTLADYADESWTCFPSQERLADETEMSVRTIARHLKVLEDGGWIRRYHRVTEWGYRTSDRFVVNPRREPTGQVDRKENEAPTGQNAQSLPDTRCAPTGHQVRAYRTPVAEEPPLTPINPQNKNSSPATPAVRNDYPPDFESWWKVYPKKTGKLAAFKQWKLALKRVSNGTLIEAADRYAADPNRVQRYTKDPERWLKKGCWEDDPLPDRGDGKPSWDDNVAAWGELRTPDVLAVES